MFRETISSCCDYHTKNTYSICDKNTLNFKAGGTESDDCVLLSVWV